MEKRKYVQIKILKTECIYRHKPKTLLEANDLIDRYIYFYNHERIQNQKALRKEGFGD